MKKLLALAIAVVMLLCFCSCGSTSNLDDKASSSSKNSSTADTSSVVSQVKSFKVTVVDGEGNVVPNVMLQVCKDSCIPAKTDENGVATFNVEITDGHKLSVLSCPAGYSYNGDDEVYLDEGATEYTLKVDAQ